MVDFRIFDVRSISWNLQHPFSCVSIIVRLLETGKEKNKN